MPQTIGSAFAETFGTGQRLGDSFSTRRFAGKAQDIRAKYEQLATTEQKPLEAYLPQMEAELREAAGSSARRGLNLEAPEVERLHADVGRAGERRAGALALANDQQGARMARAGTQYGLGNFDAGQGQQIAGDTIGATQGAMRINPATGQREYNAAAGAQGLANVGAQYGNAEAAQGQQQNAATFRLQAAQGLVGQLFNLFQSPEIADADQVTGLYEGLKQYVPELGKTDMRVGDDGSWVVYTNGKPTGSFNPKDENDMAEFSSLMTSFSRAPIEALNQYNQTRIANIADKRKQDNEFSGKIDDAMMKVITEAKSHDIPEAVATKIFSAGTGSGDSKGWQLQEIGEEPGSYIVQKGGNVYRIETNVKPGLEGGQTGGKVQVFSGDDLNTPVPASVLNAPENDGLQYSISAVSDLAKINNATALEWMRGQIGALNEMRNQRFGLSSGGGSGGNSRGERNNNPGNIEDGEFAKGLPGYKGSDGRFAIFDTPENGAAAQTKLLQSYGNRGFNTVEKIVSRWSPQSDPTNQAGSTSNYTKYVAQRLGVQPGQELNLSDPKVAAQVAAAMAEFESGNTGGSKPSGALTATAPTSGNVVAGGSDVKPATAQSAPKAQSALPASRKSITPEGARQNAAEVSKAGLEYKVAQNRLAAFEREFKPNQSGGALSQVGRLGEAALPTSNLTAAQEQVYRQLKEDLAAAEAKTRGLIRETEGVTRALNTRASKAKANEEAQELYSRYGGAADFFRNAK